MPANSLRTVLLLGATLAIGSAHAQQPDAAPQAKPATLVQRAGPPAGDAQHGQALFMRDGCWQCHGVSAQGANLSGPRLARTSLPFDGFLHQLRQPMNEMPPYEAAILPDAGAADIYAFVKQLPAPPKLEDTPLLLGAGVR